MTEKTQETTGFGTAIANLGTSMSGTVLPYLLGMALVILASKWDWHFVQPKECFKFQEVGGVLHKLDTCSGKIEQVAGVPSSMSSAPIPQVSQPK